EALLVLRAVAELAHRREEVRGMEPPRLLVEPACRAEVREPELAARVLDAGAQHVERTAPLDLGREALQELLLHRRAVVLLQPLPLLRLRGEDEVHHVPPEQAERTVVVLGAAFAVTARWSLTVGRRCLAGAGRVALAGVGA